MKNKDLYDGLKEENFRLYPSEIEVLKTLPELIKAISEDEGEKKKQ